MKVHHEGGGKKKGEECTRRGLWELRRRREKEGRERGKKGEGEGARG